MPRINYTKADMAKVVAEQLKHNAKNAKVIADSVVQSLFDALASGKRIEFRGFGTMEATPRKPRIGRDPKSPKNVYIIPSRLRVRFRPSDELDAALNSKDKISAPH